MNVSNSSDSLSTQYDYHTVPKGYGDARSTTSPSPAPSASDPIPIQRHIAWFGGCGYSYRHSYTGTNNCSLNRHYTVCNCGLSWWVEEKNNFSITKKLKNLKNKNIY